MPTFETRTNTANVRDESHMNADNTRAEVMLELPLFSLHEANAINP